jgi:hypothetical protein
MTSRLPGGRSGRMYKFRISPTPGSHSLPPVAQAYTGNQERSAFFPSHSDQEFVRDTLEEQIATIIQ